MERTKELSAAADLLRRAHALLVAAGAGMGVDSGLPDFRGNEGFWRAYPPYAKLRLNFAQLANPRWFRADPARAWGFYGHRLNLYRQTQPHEGFAILRRWAERAPGGSFVFTSNVDGHFQKAGFPPERILEIHGSIEWLQCVAGCGTRPFPTDALRLSIEDTTLRARPPLPVCPRCGSLARPNILMFDDWEWDAERTAGQEERLAEWLDTLGNMPLVVIELGAGTAIPSVRRFCERLAASRATTLVRINLREPQVPARQIGIEMGALAALRALDRLLGK